VGESARAALAGHERHDPLRAAEAVDRGARPSPILGLCDRCAGLYTDLVALTTVLPLAAYPVRRRDFTLTLGDARRLRPSGWRAWWSWIGSARDTFTQPLAIGFTTLGLAGLLLTTAPTLSMFGASAGAAPAASENLFAIMGQPGEGTGHPPGAGTSAPGTSVPPGDVRAQPGTADQDSTLALSLGLLAIGGGLFAVRRLTGRGRRVR